MKRPPLRNRLPRSFYDRPTETVAKELLGTALLRRIDGNWLGGLIVETEAYLPIDDPASHSARGETRSNSSMFARAGTLYVYPIHAKYCLNAVTQSEGLGCAVLIRAIEPLWGIEVMQGNRGQESLVRLTRGPAMLCQALQVDRSQDGLDLVGDRDLLIASADGGPLRIAATPRIGISKAQNARLRFLLRDNRYVSGKRVP
ncbi:MAG: DNA-3-methyladenine glycosylase [Rubripirellula sp.]